MQFKIFYEDGTSFTSDQINTVSIQIDGKDVKPISACPKRGVIAVVQRDPTMNWVACSGYDYYIWKRDYWRGVDFFGMLEYLKDEGYVDYGVGWKKIFYRNQWIKADIIDFFAFLEESCPVLFGRWTLSSEYDAILQVAENDREFGHKKGFLNYERNGLLIKEHK